MFGDVDDSVGIKEKPGGEGSYIDASLTELECERKIICGIDFLEISLREGVAYENPSFQRAVGGKEHGRGVHLKDVVGFFLGEQGPNASHAFGAGRLNLLPESVHFLGLGVELCFVQLSKMEAVRFGFCHSEVGAGRGSV